MGLIQTAFAASQVLGLPMSLYLSNRWNWHAPFLVLAVLGILGLAVISMKLKPVDAHLGKPQEHSPFMHLFHTITEPRHLLPFLTVTLLATGGFMLMPFGSAFLVHNLGIAATHLPVIYLITGLCTIVFGPLIGKATDKLGRFRVFLFGSTLTITMILIYTHLGVTPLPVVVLVNVLMFVGIFSRMIPFQTLATQLPEATKRGAFNAISASIQQLSGGLASVVAGHIVALGRGRQHPAFSGGGLRRRRHHADRRSWCWCGTSSASSRRARPRDGARAWPTLSRSCSGTSRRG